MRPRTAFQSTSPKPRSQGSPADAELENAASVGKIPELSVADARRVLQHRLEHGLQIAREAADDLQHLRGRRLLLQRLGRRSRASASSRVRVSSCFLIRPVNWAAPSSAFPASFRRTKLANAHSAFRALARQGHLVGTVTGPLSAGPNQGWRLPVLTELHEKPVVYSITSSARASSGRR